MRKALCIPKKTDGISENEDRLCQKSYLHSVADGAGGTGILCGEWAEYVLSNLPESAIVSFEGFIDWFRNFSDAFVEHYEPILRHDPFQLRKFYEEGSACTLAGFWIEEKEIHWLTYGDAHVFSIAEDVFESFPCQARDQLLGGTHLINWSRLPDEEGFQCGAFSLKSDAVYLLATDEISKHIFYLKESEENFHLALEELWVSLDNEKSFRQYIQRHPDIGEDDYTIIFIRS